MGVRKLPDDPIKRRLIFFKRIYQHLEHWRSQMEAGQMSDIMMTPDGEEIFYGDLLIGINALPPRQLEAFELICLKGYTETAATKIMLPNSRWSTPVQQYADTALSRMVAAYDQKQAGTWGIDPEPKSPAKTKKRRPTPVAESAVLTPDPAPEHSGVLARHLIAARDELAVQRDLINAEIEKVEAILKGAA